MGAHLCTRIHVLRDGMFSNSGCVLVCQASGRVRRRCWVRIDHISLRLDPEPISFSGYGQQTSLVCTWIIRTSHTRISGYTTWILDLDRNMAELLYCILPLIIIEIPTSTYDGAFMFVAPPVPLLVLLPAPPLLPLFPLFALLLLFPLLPLLPLLPLFPV